MYINIDYAATRLDFSTLHPDVEVFEVPDSLTNSRSFLKIPDDYTPEQIFAVGQSAGRIATLVGITNKTAMSA